MLRFFWGKQTRIFLDPLLFKKNISILKPTFDFIILFRACGVAVKCWYSAQGIPFIPRLRSIL